MLSYLNSAPLRLSLPTKNPLLSNGQKRIFSALYKWLVEQLPKDVENVETYANKKNLKSLRVIKFETQNNPYATICRRRDVDKSTSFRYNNINLYSV